MSRCSLRPSKPALRLSLCFTAGIVWLTTLGHAQSMGDKLRSEGAASLAEAALSDGNAINGALLFSLPRLNCTACHSTGSDSLLGPDLLSLDATASDTHLALSLLEPSQTIRPGFETVSILTLDGSVVVGRLIEETSTHIRLRSNSPQRQLQLVARSEIEQWSRSPISAMPIDLIDQLASRQEFLDLLRYLIELRTAAMESIPEAANNQIQVAHATDNEKLLGASLYDHFGCASCHGQLDLISPLPAYQSPRLEQVAQRVQHSYLERFVAAPLQAKPGTTMPDVMADWEVDERAAAAKQIAAYLISISKPPTREPLNEPADPENGRDLFHTVGCVACHSPRDDESREILAESSVPLGSLEAKYSQGSLTAFLESPDSVRPSNRMPDMKLTHWEALDIATYLLGAPSVAIESNERRVADATLIAEGARKFQNLGCANCHGNLESKSGEFIPPRSTQLIQNVESGCLSENIGNFPKFEMTSLQRQAIRQALAHRDQQLTAEQQLDLALISLRCTACHSRSEAGGVAPEREGYFRTNDINLGPHGRIPPTLSNVGGKLQPSWLRQVLINGESVRPYMLTRMPRYSAEQIDPLIELFQRLDQLPDRPLAPIVDEKATRDAGHMLVGSTGLNCIACHSFQQKSSGAMAALDLTDMGNRLQSNWFERYMGDPQRWSPGTVMPSFWPGGRALRSDILEGHASQQIDALWFYLLDGRQARTPQGLRLEPMQLLAGAEAVMLRRSYPGVGKRGIGVGYPAELNLVFDAEQLRLATLWRGMFADPAGVWRSQGHGMVRPLGEAPIALAQGPELDDAEHPWIVDDGRPPDHRFLGYSLDAMQRPIFSYQFGQVTVEDYLVDRTAQSPGQQPIFHRTLNFRGLHNQPQTHFRVARDGRITSISQDSFKVGERLVVRILPPNRGIIQKTSSGSDLIVKLPIDQERYQVVIEYVW